MARGSISVLLAVLSLAIGAAACDHKSKHTIHPLQKILNTSGAEVILHYRKACGACADPYTPLPIPAGAVATVQFPDYTEISYAAMSEAQESAELQFSGDTSGFVVCLTGGFDRPGERYAMDLKVPAAYAAESRCADPSLQVWGSGTETAASTAVAATTSATSRETSTATGDVASTIMQSSPANE